MKITKFIVLSILIALFQNNAKAQFSKIWEREIYTGGNWFVLGAENTDTDNQKEILVITYSDLYLIDGQSGNIDWQSPVSADNGTLIDVNSDGTFEILFNSWDDNKWYLYGLPGMTINEINRSNIQSSNYPNPFSQTTTIKYTVYENGTLVIVKIFDSTGQEIKTLVNEIKSAGEYEILFNGFNLSSGMYYYQVNIGNEIGTKKMIKMELTSP